MDGLALSHAVPHDVRGQQVVAVLTERDERNAFEVQCGRSTSPIASRTRCRDRSLLTVSQARAGSERMANSVWVGPGASGIV
jgi:hypothetical protein